MFAQKQGTHDWEWTNETHPTPPWYPTGTHFTYLKWMESCVNFAADLLGFELGALGCPFAGTPCGNRYFYWLI